MKYKQIRISREKRTGEKKGTEPGENKTERETEREREGGGEQTSVPHGNYRFYLLPTKLFEQVKNTDKRFKMTFLQITSSYANSEIIYLGYIHALY